MVNLVQIHGLKRNCSKLLILGKKLVCVHISKNMMKQTRVHFPYLLSIGTWFFISTHQYKVDSTWYLLRKKLNISDLEYNRFFCVSHIFITYQHYTWIRNIVAIQASMSLSSILKNQILHSSSIDSHKNIETKFYISLKNHNTWLMNYFIDMFVTRKITE